MPLVNIPSVLQHGILSNERASKLKHHSVAMQAIQDRRDKKQVPGGLKLHQYANLYFHARNPMLYKRKGEAANLCVLQISTEVIRLDGVVVTDQNAASNYVRFLHPYQSHLLDFDAIFAPDWRHPNDEIAYYRHSSQKCAEILVPHRVDPSLIVGAYVVNAASATRLRAACGLPIHVDRDLFFG
jgi:hypothetical protein